MRAGNGSAGEGVSVRHAGGLCKQFGCNHVNVCLIFAATSAALVDCVCLAVEGAAALYVLESWAHVRAGCFLMLH